MDDAPRLVLVRHGQARLGTDDYDRLSERGHRQALRVADSLSPDASSGAALWSGTLLRHRQTMTPMAGAGDAGVLRTDDLNEFSTQGLVKAALGHADRLGLAVPPREQLADPVTHLEVLLAWFPAVMAAWQEGHLSDPATGSWSAFRQRVLRPIDEWASSLRDGQSVIVVSSAGVIATLVAALAGRDLAWQRSLAVSLYNASISELALVEGDWRVERCNCTRHLESDGLRTLA
jgi:broad specificity phosphatase PhoE